MIVGGWVDGWIGRQTHRQTISYSQIALKMMFSPTVHKSNISFPYLSSRDMAACSLAVTQCTVVTFVLSSR
jgi:hypothetical protein